jgi:hypothetical protein
MNDTPGFQHKFRQSLQWREGQIQQNFKTTNSQYDTPRVDTRQIREQQQQSSSKTAAIQAMAHPE